MKPTQHQIVSRFLADEIVSYFLTIWADAIIDLDRMGIPDPDNIDQILIANLRRVLKEIRMGQGTAPASVQEKVKSV